MSPLGQSLPDKLRVLIVGDGPAGYLAALVFRRAGHAANLTAGPSERLSHAKALHWLRPEIIDIAQKLDGDLAERLKREQEPGWTFWYGAHGCDNSWTCPRLSRVGFEHVLTVANDAALVTVNLDNIVPRNDKWYIGTSEFDLIVDATGGRRALFNNLHDRGAIAATLEDAGTSSSYLGYNLCPGDVVGEKSFGVWSMPDRLFVLERSEIGTAGSVISDRPLRPDVLEQDLCDAPEKFSAVWKILLNKDPDIRLRPPPLRRVLLDAKASVLAFGDAALQLPPRTGFGLTSLMQQSLALSAALQARMPANRLHQAIEECCAEIWSGAALQSGLSQWREGSRRARPRTK